MLEVADFILSCFAKLWTLFERITFEYGGQEVSYGSVILVFLILFIAISVLWKGARA